MGLFFKAWLLSGRRECRTQPLCDRFLHTMQAAKQTGANNDERLQMHFTRFG